MEYISKDSAPMMASYIATATGSSSTASPVNLFDTDSDLVPICSPVKLFGIVVIVYLQLERKSPSPR